MASSSKQKTTMAKRDRENRLRERREMKRAKKDARKLAALAPDQPAEAAAHEDLAEGDHLVAGDDLAEPGETRGPTAEQAPADA